MGTENPHDPYSSSLAIAASIRSRDRQHIDQLTQSTSHEHFVRLTNLLQAAGDECRSSERTPATEAWTSAFDSATQRSVVERPAGPHVLRQRTPFHPRVFQPAKAFWGVTSCEELPLHKGRVGGSTEERLSCGPIGVRHLGRGWNMAGAAGSFR